jgi:chemotaxis response regulator CheB
MISGRVSPCESARCVIAIAASVGGLKALSLILGGLPGDFPAAIAIVMHVSPEHKSLRGLSKPPPSKRRFCK